MEKAPATKITQLIILQIALGVLICFCSRVLAVTGITILLVETILLMVGLAVIACGIYLRKAHVKMAGGQLIAGVIIVGISASLILRILELNQRAILGLSPPDALFGLGATVSVLGLIQLILRLTGEPQSDPVQELIKSRYPVRGLTKRPAA